MGKSKDLATGSSYVDTTGDTMTGRLSIQESAAAGEGILLTNGHNVAGTYSDLKWAYSVADQSYGSGLRFKQVDTTHGGQLEFYTDNASGSYTKQMQITENGHVTKPNQPHIYGSVGNTGGSGSSGAGICNRMYVQTSGGGMTFSNSRITVPVAGVYMVSWQTLTNSSGSGRYDTNIRLNGTDISNGLNNASDQSSDYRMRTHVLARDLAANDYLQFNHAHPYATGAAFDPWAIVSVFLLG